MAAYAHRARSRRRHADSATATAAEVMSTSTPVAYAPPCASTSARKMTVTSDGDQREHHASGRRARAHSGAIP